MAIRKKTGGRKAGTPNKETVSLQQLLDRVGCDPREIMAMIALNKLPCGVCRGTGKTLYKKPLKPRVKCENCGYENPVAFVHCKVCEGQPEVELAHRICMSCYGTLMEACSPQLRGSMCGELLQYQMPKRKAIEHTGADGVPIQATVTVRFVKSPHANATD